LPPIDARALGQILLIESLVAQLPNRKAMLQFAARGLEEMPGISKVWFQEEPPEASASRAFELRHDGRRHAWLCFKVVDEPVF